MKPLRVGATPCAYCGTPDASDRDHVIPRCLYPASSAGSTVQRVTVPACRSCNGGWSDDEVQFRNVLMVAGPANEAREELWTTSVQRSFDKVDGPRRASDLLALMVPVVERGVHRHRVYPEQHEPTMRVVRKIVRGLVHHHGLGTAIPDGRVDAEVLKEGFPSGFLEHMQYEHRDPEIADYHWTSLPSDDIHSFWLLRFYRVCVFRATVFRHAASGNDNESGRPDGLRRTQT